MPAEITELTMRDYDEALALWQRTQGVSLRGADSRDAIERYLRRNPGSSFVARVERTDVRLMSLTMSASPNA